MKARFRKGAGPSPFPTISPCPTACTSSPTPPADATSDFPKTSESALPSTTTACPNGPQNTARGHSCGRVDRCRCPRQGSWKIYSRGRRAAMACNAYSTPKAVRQAHNPASAGSWVQIPALHPMKARLRKESGPLHFHRRSARLGLIRAQGALGKGTPHWRKQLSSTATRRNSD